MKKLFTLLMCTACSLTMLATEYTGQLTVNINGEPMAALDNVAVQIDQNGTDYTLALNNFVLEEGMGVGNIVLPDLAATAGNNGLTLLAVNRGITIAAGDLEGVDMWLGPMLGIVPIHMVASFNNTYLVADIDIDMTASLGQTIKVHFTNDVNNAYAGTFQIPNSDFEKWTASSGEPDHWHGFKSASGSLASMAKGTLAKSTDIRSGATGTYSAVVTSASTLGIVNNGTMTNGQLNAGSMSATNTANHSQMDISSTATDKNGHKFYTALAAAPDAISLWVKFTQKTANASYPYATMSAIVFDGTYYQDPEDKTYTNVAAKAANKQIAVCGWSNIVVPFDYAGYASNNAAANAILMTVSTNATPGKGSSGDQLFVDDVELLYYANINAISCSAISIPAFDADTHHYSVSYEGEPKSLNADQFTVTTGSQSAMLVKNVEDLGGGNFRVAIAAVSADMKISNIYTYDINRMVPLDEALAADAALVNIGETLYTVFGNADEGIIYTTDGQGNWIAVVADEETFNEVINANAISNASGSISGTSLNPVLTLTAKPTTVDAAPEFTDFETIDLTETFSAKANGIYNVHGYIDNDGRLRAYSGNDGAQGQSLDINTCYLPNANLEAGKAYNIQAVFTIKDSWSGAPRRVAADGERYFDNYTILPISVNVATGVTQVDAARTIAAVERYDLTGRRIADEHFNGAVITVTRYTDGTATVTKSIR